MKNFKPNGSERLHDLPDPLANFRELRKTIKLLESVKSPEVIKLRKRIILSKAIKLLKSVILSKSLILPFSLLLRKIYCQRVTVKRCSKVSKECACNTCTPCKGAAPPLTPHTVDVDSVMSCAERLA